MLIQLGRGLSSTPSNINSILSPTLDTTSKTIALIGDSITSQNDSSNDKEFTSQGYMTWLNAMTGQRYYYQPSHNLGNSGQTIATTLANITDLNTLSPTPNLVFFIPFANDITGARPYAELISDLDDIIDFVTVTLGAKMVLTTPLPRTQDNGSALTNAQQTLLNNLKSYVMSLDVDGVTTINIYDNMTGTAESPDILKFDNEGGKYLHPTPAGAYQIAMDLKTYLDNVYGSNSTPDMSICDLGLNSNLSGTAGSENSALPSATIADNWNLYSYSNMTGSANKNGNSEQALNLTYTNSRSFDIWELQASDISTGFTTGEQYYMEAEIKVVNASNVRTALCLEPTLNATGSYKAMSPYDVNSWPTNYTGALHLRTPMFEIAAGDTNIAPILWAQMNSLGVTSNTNIVIKQVRFVKL